MTVLRILHLYPRELGINGDAGNVLALAERARWRGVEADIVTHNPGAELPASVDVIHIGSGPLSSQRAVLADVVRIAPRLLQWRDGGVPILAIAGGWQLLGSQIQTAEGDVLAGAGVFPTRAVLGTRRHVAEVVVRMRDGVTLAGFENHSATTTLDANVAGAEPLGDVVSGFGNGDKTEGVTIANAIGTHLHGPLLPMNPVLADRMLQLALRGELPPVSQTERVDRYATNARRAIAARLGVAL